MNAIRFSAINDLRAWVREAMGSDASAEDAEAVAGWIQTDPARPHWGLADWSAYLDGLDLYHILTGLGR